MESPGKGRELSKEEVQDAQIGLLEWEIERLGKDPLTGVMARATFLKELEHALKAMQSPKHDKRKGSETLRELSVLFIDLDNFKHVNEDNGHIEGDRVLVEAAKCITKSVREGRDVVGRFGGDEFCVFLPRTNKEQALIVGTNVLNEMRGNESLKLHDITASIGAYYVSSENSAGLTATDIVKRADDAEIRAKKEGKNTIVIDGVDKNLYEPLRTTLQ